MDYILANDFSENAVESIKENIVLNGVEDKVRANFGDAMWVFTDFSHFSFGSYATLYLGEFSAMSRSGFL